MPELCWRKKRLRICRLSHVFGVRLARVNRINKDPPQQHDHPERKSPHAIPCAGREDPAPRMGAEPPSVPEPAWAHCPNQGVRPTYALRQSSVYPAVLAGTRLPTPCRLKLKRRRASRKFLRRSLGSMIPFFLRPICRLWTPPTLLAHQGPLPPAPATSHRACEK